MTLWRKVSSLVSVWRVLLRLSTLVLGSSGSEKQSAKIEVIACPFSTIGSKRYKAKVTWTCLPAVLAKHLGSSGVVYVDWIVDELLLTETRYVYFKTMGSVQAMSVGEINAGVGWGVLSIAKEDGWQAQH